MMSEKNTLNQENRLCDLFRDAVRASGLSKDEAQKIIMNGGTMQLDVKKIFQKLSIAADNFFGFVIKEFEITIPNNYDHDSQIDIFVKKEKFEKIDFFCSKYFTSRNFAKATNKLIPGKTYKVKIVPILKKVESEDCIAFLRRQNAILVGGQGLTLVCDLAKDQLPKGKLIISFDEKDALWEDFYHSHMVPSMYSGLDNDLYFKLHYFGLSLRAGNYLLCVCL